MSGVGTCYDNAAKESWFPTFRAEAGGDDESENHAQLTTLDDIQCFHPNHGRHKRLGFKAPRAFERNATACPERAGQGPETDDRCDATCSSATHNRWTASRPPPPPILVLAQIISTSTVRGANIAATVPSSTRSDPAGEGRPPTSAWT
jgi:hypothetical protein